MRRARSPVAGTLLRGLALVLGVLLRLLVVLRIETTGHSVRSPKSELRHAQDLSTGDETRCDAERPIVAQAAQESFRCSAESFLEESLRCFLQRLVARNDTGHRVEH